MTDPAQRLLIWFSVLSVFTFLLFGWDKLMAKLNRTRIPEAGLLSSAFFGGGTGALLGMLLFRHKIRKKPFPILVPLLFLLQLLLLVIVWQKGQ